jgi:hypothetical protein
VLFQKSLVINRELVSVCKELFEVVHVVGRTFQGRCVEPVWLRRLTAELGQGFFVEFAEHVVVGQVSFGLVVEGEERSWIGFGRVRGVAEEMQEVTQV